MIDKTLLKRVLIYVGTAVGCIASVFLAFKLSFYFAPFLIALAIATISEPLIRLMNKKLKVPRKLASVISLLIVLATVGSIVTLLIIKVISLAEEFYINIDMYYYILYSNVTKFMEKATELYLQLPDELSTNLQHFFVNFTGSLTGFLKTIAKGVFTTAISIPDAVFFIIITIIATYFISSDRNIIIDSIRRQIPTKWINKVIDIKNDMFSALFGYIRAQLILMCITTVELSTGFLILGIKNAVVIGILIGIFDALPIFGTGGIVIPWAIICFLTGSVPRGLSLLIIYGIVTIVRQLIEPKVVGTQIGVHPLITLLSMYLGLRLVGVWGMIAGPITVLLLKNVINGLQKSTSLKEIFESND